VSNGRESTGGLLGLLGVGMALCCGLPLLLGAGLAIGAAALAFGSTVVAAAAIALGMWSWRRRQRHRCDTAQHSEPLAAEPTDTGPPRAHDVREP
jgi:hypothetical protein